MAYPQCMQNSQRESRTFNERQFADAKRIRIPGENLLETVYRLADAMPTATSSTAQDIARGRPTEIDHINGYIARQGEILGIPTTVNRTLHALVKLLETPSLKRV
jgi:2-dehydropantoate 2-reductase